MRQERCTCRSRLWAMTGFRLIHRVPYYSQWESAALVAEFVSGVRGAAEDPLWLKSGADSAEDYAFWAPRMCGMACLRMALDHWGHEVPPSVPLVREAVEAGHTCGPRSRSRG